MFRKETGHFEHDGTTGQAGHPFRISGSSAARFVFGLIAKTVAAMMTFGFVPLALLLFGALPAAWTARCGGDRTDRR